MLKLTPHRQQFVGFLHPLFYSLALGEIALCRHFVTTITAVVHSLLNRRRVDYCVVPVSGRHPHFSARDRSSVCSRTEVRSNASVRISPSGPGGRYTNPRLL